jgi:hypothetical protein
MTSLLNTNIRDSMRETATTRRVQVLKPDGRPLLDGQPRPFGAEPIGIADDRDDAGLFHLSLPPLPQERAVALMLSQYQASPNFLAYVDAYMEEVDELTTAMLATYLYRYPAYAYGAMLDVIAEIVGVARQIPGARPLGLFGWYDDPASFGHNDFNDPASSGGKLYSDGEILSGDLNLTDEELSRYIQAAILVNTQLPTIASLYNYTDLLYGTLVDTWELQEGYATTPGTPPTANMHFDGFLNIQERGFFSAVYLRFKIVGVELTLSDSSGNIILLKT